MLKSLVSTASLLALLCGALSAQEPEGRKTPSVTMLDMPTAAVTRGKANAVELRFRIAPGFHVNSNTPKAEFLIPTKLKIGPADRHCDGKNHLSGRYGDELSLRPR